MSEIEEYYNNHFKKAFEVYEIFKEFFGEEFVDLQGLQPVEAYSSISAINSISSLDILVYFPTVRVTNEHDRSVDITKLFVKVTIKPNGKLLYKFTMNRSEYTYNQFVSNYMHSHICDIPYTKTEFQVPCTGSGPINNTMGSLLGSFDRHLWNLFCLELSNYVKVESLEGVPYHRLEEISSGSTAMGSAYNYILYKTFTLNRNCSEIPEFLQFISYLVDRQVLKYRYNDGIIELGMSKIDAAILITNEYLKYLRSLPTPGRWDTICRKYVKVNGIYRQLCSRSHSREPEGCEGELVCTFKGVPQYLHIESPERGEQQHYTYILDEDIVNFIITNFLNVLNNYYGETEIYKEGAKINQKKYQF